MFKRLKSAEVRSFGIALALLCVKVLTTIRTAIDTYNVTQDALNVALIDGAFFAFWAIVAYGGDGKRALAIRPFAAAFAWSLYAAMIYIGIEAHHDITALFVRGAGFMALLFDTYTYGVTLIEHLRRQRRSVDIVERRRRRRVQRWERAYRFALSTLGTVKMRWEAFGLVLRDIQGDIDHADASAPSALPATPRKITQRSGLGVTYDWQPNEPVRCIACGWESAKPKATQKSAGAAYSGHSKGCEAISIVTIAPNEKEVI